MPLAKNAAVGTSVDCARDPSHLVNAAFLEHAGIRARTSLDFNYWESHLQNHPDPEFVEYILNCIKFGVDIGYRGKIHTCISDNWPSAEKYSTHIAESINLNISKGRVAGPFDHPPLKNFVASPLGAFAKNRLGKLKVRTIHDLSWPPGRSINDGINPEDCKLTYQSIDHVVQLCQEFEKKHGQPPMLAKCDLTSAFSHIIVQTSDWHKLGFTFNGKYYVSLCLPFGLRSSPKIFDMFAQGLEFMAIQNGTNPETSHYLDDTITLGLGYANTDQSIEIFKHTAKDSGWEIQETKCTKPDYETEHLGVMFDTPNHQLRISADRLSEICALLREWLSKNICTKRQLLSLIGKLSFVARVVRCSRTFLRRLIDLSKRVRFLHFKIKLNCQARADIAWWLTNIESHNGVSYFPEPWVDNDNLQLWTDASNVAAGAVFKNEWFCVPFIGDKKWMADMPIAWRELYIVVLSLNTWGEKMIAHRITLNVDNMAICHCINKGSSKNPELMELIRCLYYVMFKYDMECKAVYLPSAANVQADAISRLDFITFRNSKPESNRWQTGYKEISYYGIAI